MICIKLKVLFCPWNFRKKAIRSSGPVFSDGPQPLQDLDRTTQELTIDESVRIK